MLGTKGIYGLHLLLINEPTHSRGKMLRNLQPMLPFLFFKNVNGRKCANILFLHCVNYMTIQSQKKRVAEEEHASRKRGLGIRLLPGSAEDAAAASRVKFSSKFEENRKLKRALISTSSIFSVPSGSSSNVDKRLDLEAKRRKIKAARVSNLLAGGFKPSGWNRA